MRRRWEDFIHLSVVVTLDLLVHLGKLFEGLAWTSSTYV
jgi:hypothetical protein